MKLYLVPSPIGNLADITYRAVKVLEEADLVLAEDTRTSGVLLKHYNINKPITPYHQHNEHKVLQHLLQQLQAGKTMALITDAGTPGVSDPGFLLVRECVRAGVPVECLPGATAFVPALVNSGIPMTRFSFEGFLPLKKGRHTLFTQLSTDERTLVFYESPHRLVKTLEDMMGYFGADRPCCVSRELTKMFEENKRGTLQEVHDYYKEKGVKGEIVLILQGAIGKKKSQEEEE
ncbi:16S rRNA (cytidine(1402)-2'-O)-methyltransferase [Chitinophaga silvisoli]|uniref:Ribosomal RNA small subunit methyltransferase I n=1 Tax=Chitinophaga silvisoli TaxID=2291814 RepID=A0A3E1P260_9BACT|nr:16S rRNA (cytidine(1402)-2'-O)-methyltransferase [Chitinophaga silvisoli]RFM34245.1 16S rRNA (cytidine(1402)-2'-O)-methyltransferase [Chitinophaga silvisoli]